ncbi:MAG: type IV toxin-antitoxin system AbiEi family antitoxin domain-containing protein [Nocardioides sp.]
MDPAVALPLRADSRLPLDRPFTYRQALAAGLTRHVLGRLLRDGLVHRVLKGVYVDAVAEDDQLLRARALALVLPAGAVVTDRTAGWLHGAQVLAPNDHLQLPPLDVFQAPGNTRVRARGTRGGERTLAPGDVTTVHGIRVTTPLRTALDLGRLTPREQAMAALDALLRLGRFTSADLRGSVERFRRQRGVVQLRQLAPLADARAESPPESVLRLRWHDADLPAVPVPQLEVREHGILRYRLDLGVEELRFAAEYDGRDWHTSPEARVHDRARRQWLRERGWVIVVLTREDLFGPDRSRAVRRIRAELDPLLRRAIC